MILTMNDMAYNLNKTKEGGRELDNIIDTIVKRKKNWVGHGMRLPITDPLT